MTLRDLIANYLLAAGWQQFDGYSGWFPPGYRKPRKNSRARHVPYSLLAAARSQIDVEYGAMLREQRERDEVAAS